MRLDPIEKNVVRVVGITLAIVIVFGGGLAYWSRYRIFAEQKTAEQRREYEQQMAELMEQELLAQGMTRGVVKATLGAPDSITGLGEILEVWHYDQTRNYGAVALRFERDALIGIQRKDNPSER